MTGLVPIRRALLSVSDKRGLVGLARARAGQGVSLVSTGGSARALRDAGIAVTDVSEHTGFPEILDGRVKTLVPQIHGGILGRRNDPAHRAQMERHAIAPIDLVVVNLYPFEATVAAGRLFADCIENIDIGGPALVRAAAKNHEDVAVLTSPGQYEAFEAELAGTGGTRPATRRRLAAAAYAATAAYDSAVAAWFARETAEGSNDFPAQFTLAGRLKEVLRYGENPHQRAAFYVGGTPRPGLATATQLQGKALSYNNLNDTDAAFEVVAEFDVPACVIVKHANPCGVATAGSALDAWRLALRCDPVSAFGGIVALNRTLDRETADAIGGIFTEVIIAPDATDGARDALARRRNLRLLVTGGMPDRRIGGDVVRSVAGGFLLQGRDTGRVVAADLRTVTKRAPDARELADLVFAFRVAKHVKSNAIVHARDGATVGLGAGQMSRVDSARIAATKGEEATRAAGLEQSLLAGSVAASDAFFPFADGLEVIVASGATAVIQPGGSVRDNEVIEAADRAGLAMVFTGMRHFRH